MLHLKRSRKSPRLTWTVLEAGYCLSFDLVICQTNLCQVTPTEVLDHTAIENHECHEFLKRVRQIGSEFTAEELAAQAFSAVVPTAAHFSQAIAHVVNFYIDDDKRSERDEIVKLAFASRDKDVMVYVREALRESYVKISSVTKGAKNCSRTQPTCD